MGTEAFYTTAAQVIPTILIALAVEFGLILRQLGRELERARNRDAEGPKAAPFVRNTETIEKDTDQILTISMGMGVVFAVGEVSALLALAFRWFNGWTFAGVSICLVVMIAAAAFIPIVRLHDDADW
ncbi:hypothetical protein ACIBQX_04180 [Nonomuraea sp. NPDC049714]|uniref:hypothetical protein n=1 Tax=Nonomuraea sp. NPDC049714 TaxID=3364357 RepID=UPI0037B99178